MTDVLFDTEEQRKPPTKNKCYQVMAIALKFMQSGVRWEKKISISTGYGVELRARKMVIVFTDN